MPILTSPSILQRIEQGTLSFTPKLDELQLQSHAVDLRLGFTYLTPKLWRLTPAGREAAPIKDFATEHRDNFHVVELEQGQFFDLLPGEYTLASTLENIRLSADIMGIVYPRSSTNRRGLVVDLTGVVDSGYEGRLIIPIKNNNPAQIVRLYPGERFCQLVLQTLDQSIQKRPSRYHHRDVVETVVVHNIKTDRDN